MEYRILLNKVTSSVVIYLQSFYDILYFCSWISVGMGFITLLLFVFLFKEVDVSAKERQYAKDCKRARGKWAMKMGCLVILVFWRVQYIFSYMHTMYLLVQLSVELTEIFSHCFFREINAFSGKKHIESCVHEIFFNGAENSIIFTMCITTSTMLTFMIFQERPIPIRTKMNCPNQIWWQP